MGMISYSNNSGFTVCVSVCPLGYYIDYNTYMCRLCQYGCDTCTNSTICITCKIGYYALDIQCVSECPIGYLSISGKCLPCISPCLGCTVSLLKCTSCLSAFYLFNDQCISACPSGYYSISSTCSKCPSLCATCSSSGACTTCTNTLYSAPSCIDNTICLSNQYKISATQCANCHVSCATCYGGT